jgi:hypothetical protein
MSQSNAPFSDEEVLAELLATFPPALESKFREGMKKYASPLTAKNCLDEAFPEVMDLVVYLTAERMKRDKLIELLDDAYSFVQDEMLYSAKVKIQEASDLIRPRPLAVKVDEVIRAGDGTILTVHKTSSPEATS